MKKSKITPLREPLSRLWFISRGYTQADTRYTNGQIIWLHPETNTVLSKYGYKLALVTVPTEKHLAKSTRYLKLNERCGNMLLARLKYLTFKGDIPAGYTIDHIDGNTFNNDIRNLRAVPQSINSRDGGFMRKLRHSGYDVAMFPGIILEGYERMAQWKGEHSEYAYKQLRGEALLQVFVGPTFTVADPDYLMELDLSNHREF